MDYLTQKMDYLTLIQEFYYKFESQTWGSFAAPALKTGGGGKLWHMP